MKSLGKYGMKRSIYVIVISEFLFFIIILKC